MNLRAPFVSVVGFLSRLSCVGLTTKHSFVRYAMYKRLEAVGRQLPKTGRVLSISHSQHLCEIMGITPTEVVHANYPEFNILNLPFPDESFDFVLSDQVFEHVEGNPQRAFDECLRVLKKGGHAVHTTAMIMGVHGEDDFWRFTPRGLAYLARNASRIIEASGWGYPGLPLLTFLGLNFSPVPEARWHPIHILAMLNRPSYPHVVWVVAKKE